MTGIDRCWFSVPSEVVLVRRSVSRSRVRLVVEMCGTEKEDEGGGGPTETYVGQERVP